MHQQVVGGKVMNILGPCIIYQCVVSENIHVHPKKGFSKFQVEGGSQGPKIFKGEFEPKVEFLEAWGFQAKSLSMRGVLYLGP